MTKVLFYTGVAALIAAIWGDARPWLLTGGLLIAIAVLVKLYEIGNGTANRRAVEYRSQAARRARREKLK